MIRKLTSFLCLSLLAGAAAAQTQDMSSTGVALDRVIAIVNEGVVLQSQLEEVGFKVDLQVSDWATVVQRRNKPELWDAFSTAFVFVPEPANSSQVLCEWTGWW